jgi:sugar/nucleoside kinase (ribokinase family)
LSESYLALGGIIIDDLVYEDGTTSMGVLGGGGLYAALGSRIWSEDVYMVARVGHDFSVISISEKGLHTEYIELTSLPTPRAWQLLDSNDERTQIPRVSADDWYSQLVIEQHDIPDISDLTGIHILGRGSEAEYDIINLYSTKGTTISYEPVVDHNTDTKRIAAIIRCLRMVNIFSPDLLACEVLADLQDPTDAGRWFAERGPQVVVLRMGKHGAILFDSGSNEMWKVPSCADQILNTVGAGNAFCGGFLAGWCPDHDLSNAGASAAISASITMENLGPPTVSIDLSKRALELHRQFMPRISKQ